MYASYLKIRKKCYNTVSFYCDCIGNFCMLYKNKLLLLTAFVFQLVYAMDKADQLEPVGKLYQWEPNLIEQNSVAIFRENDKAFLTRVVAPKRELQHPSPIYVYDWYMQSHIKMVNEFDVLTQFCKDDSLHPEVRVNAEWRMKTLRDNIVTHREALEKFLKGQTGPIGDGLHLASTAATQLCMIKRKRREATAEDIEALQNTYKQGMQLAQAHYALSQRPHYNQNEYLERDSNFLDTQ